MDLGNLLRILGRRAWLILGCALIGGLFACALQYRVRDGELALSTGRHRVSVQILLDLPDVDPDGMNNALLRLLFAPHGISQFAESHSFAEAVSVRVGGVYSPHEVKENFHSFGIVPTSLLHFDLYGDSPADATALAWASVAEFQDWLATRQVQMNVPESARFVTEMTSRPQVSEAVSEAVKANQWISFGTFAGLTIGIVLAWGLPTPKRRRPEDSLDTSMALRPSFFSAWAGRPSPFAVARERISALCTQENRRFARAETKRRGKIFVVCILFGMAVVSVVEFTIDSNGVQLRAGRYRASARMVIDLPSVDAAFVNQAAVRLLLTPTMHEDIVRSRTFAREISERVDGVYTPEEVFERLDARWMLATPMLRIEMLGDTPEDALALVNASVAVYEDWVRHTQEQANVPERNRMIVTPVDQPALVDVVPENADIPTWLVFGAVCGAVFGAVFALTSPFETAETTGTARMPAKEREAVPPDDPSHPAVPPETTSSSHDARVVAPGAVAAEDARPRQPQPAGSATDFGNVERGAQKPKNVAAPFSAARVGRSDG